jgi:ADP-ribose diphosphatase
MPKKPEITDRRQLANTGIFNIEEMDLHFANGATRQYQRIVGSPQGAVLVVPMRSDQELLLIREYAAGMERYELGFPKGHIEAGEDALQAANRESREETGYAARQLEEIAAYTVAPGYLYHTTHVVLARDLYPDRLPGDEPETIEVVPWRLDDLEGLLARGDFTEARSIAAFYRVRELLLKTPS